MITEVEYTNYRARYDRRETWVKQNAWNGGKWISYNLADLPEDSRISNEETGKIEQFEFMRDKPTIYTSYILSAKDKCNSWNADHYFGTWTGDHLGRIVSSWESTRFAFGYKTKHRSLVVLGDNGILYYGTFFYTAGDYVTLRAYKHQEEKKREYGISS